MQNHQPNQEGELLYLLAQDYIMGSLFLSGADYGKTRVGWTVFKAAPHGLAVLSEFTQENVSKNAQTSSVQLS